jgi:RHS repeat-associated protein
LSSNSPGTSAHRPTSITRSDQLTQNSNVTYLYSPLGKQDSVVVYGTGGHVFTCNDKELDEELGFDMYYYGARFYDPSIGRFTTPDPVMDYYNPYSYV